MSHPVLHVIGKGDVRIGHRTSIAPDAQVVFVRPATVTIGDYCTVGPGVKFVCDGGDVSLGDWTTLHDRCLVLSTAGASIGQHGWFGQHCVIDGTGGLSIGHGVRVGMYSQIWTHVAAGEQIEGCTLYGMRPVHIEDDVWLVGSCIVASGVTLGRRTVALIASNITKSWPDRSVLAGSPAAPKVGLSFYREITRDEQWDLLAGWLRELASLFDLSLHEAPGAFVLQDAQDGQIAFVCNAADVGRWIDSHPQSTVCCLETKHYVKRLTGIEHRVLKALAGNRARFLSDAGNAA